MNYSVVSGDTLNKIAARFGVSTAEIAQLNGISDINKIAVGQSLQLPPNRQPNKSMSGEPAKNPAEPKFSTADIDHVVQLCPTEEVEPPEIAQHLRVIDREDFQGYSVVRSYDPISRTITIVQKEKADEIEIDYSGPEIPADLDVKLSTDSKYHKTFPGSGSWKIPVSYKLGELPYKGSLSSLFTAKHRPCVYSITGIPGRPIKVRVLNPDQWLLEISVPPFESFKVGYKGTVESKSASAGATTRVDRDTGSVTARANASLNVQSDVIKSTVIQKGGIFSKPSKTEIEQHFRNNTTLGAALWSKEGIDGPLDTGLLNFSQSANSRSTAHASASSDSSLPVKLSLNGEYVKLDVLQIIGSIIKMAKAICDLINAIKNLKGQVKIGWYFEIEFKLMDGAITIGWGWREREDHLADYHVAVGASVTLYEVEAKIGVGLEFKDVGVSAELFAKGSAKLELGPFEVAGPGDLGGLNIGQIIGQIEIGGAVVGKLGGLARASGEIKSGITMKCDVFYADVGGMETSLGMERDPVTATFEVKTKLTWTWKKSYETTLIEGGKLFDDLRFPGKEIAETSLLKTVDDIARRIEEHLTAGWWPIRFHSNTYEVTWYGRLDKDEVEFDTARVAKSVANKIYERRDRIELSHRVIDGIAQAIRDACEELGDRWGRDSIELGQWNEFTRSNEFQQILKNAESPVLKSVDSFRKHST